MFDITQLQQDLQTRLNSLDATESREEIVSLSVALSNLTNKRFLYVAKYDDLPNLTVTPLPSGSIVLVEQLDILMMVVGNQWKGLDGRTYISRNIINGLGFNLTGQLGDNTTTSRLSPVTVVGGVIDWIQTSTNGGPFSSTFIGHSLGVTSSGLLYAWGSNVFGQLGDNTLTNRSSPVTVVGGITNWKQVSVGTGGGHSLGVTTTGIAYGWGNGSNGQLGTGTSGKSSPTSVIGGITNWSQVSAGGSHSLGVTSTGIAYAWGFNGNGRLGDNTTSQRTSPVTVVGGITNWSQISAGSLHSLGLTSTGVAYAWGYNGSGQLGDGTTTSRLSPVTVIGGITNWKQISAGTTHSLGLTSTGVLYGWGNNTYGQLGSADIATNKSSPIQMMPYITTWIDISAGFRNSLNLFTI